jgi:hypothetical protein
MDLSKLSVEEKNALKQQFESEERAERERIAAERETYKDLVDATVVEQVKRLQKVSDGLLLAKEAVFDAFGAIVQMKSELFNLREKQQTHTFTTRDGLAQMTIGYRVNEGWDDTADAGIAKVREFLATLARDDNSAVLVETVMRLLSRDAKGNLKASKILELDKLAAKLNNEEFTDAIKIIKDAYRPAPTCRFVDVRVRGEVNEPWQNVPLSISVVDVK